MGCVSAQKFSFLPTRIRAHLEAANDMDVTRPGMVSFPDGTLDRDRPKVGPASTGHRIVFQPWMVSAYSFRAEMSVVNH
jgi:hypothetical protein